MGVIVALGAAPLPAGRPETLTLFVVAIGLAVLALLWYADVLRPGSFRRAGGRALPTDPDRAVPWHLWLLAAIMTYLALVTAAGVAVSIAGITTRDAGIRAHAVVGVAGYSVAAVAGLALVHLFGTRARTPGAGLRARATDLPVGLALIALAAPVILAVSAVAPAVYARLTGDTPDPVAHTQLRMILESRAPDGGLSPWVWPLVISAAVGAPVVEDLIYRVFLQTSILALTRSHWAAILVTSTAFTAVHAGSVPIYAMPVLFTLAVAIGTAYERTGRLGVPIVMHAAFNTANLAVTLAAA